MSDYGHDLLLGSFITPSNADPQQTVALAQVCEQSGLDLVTFQDHPYQPRFLDTWTLLSYVAARTERIHLSANVHNLPLRPPAVLARAAASLDLLSGGRFELALGAGGFWDAIEAMGGGRLSPGQSIEALKEAIDIIRGIWDVDNRERLVVEGARYRVDGAKRGPAPAHDIPIWIGAYQPRMLRLIGRTADGWLPTLSYVKSLTELAQANTRIDEAAAQAGRDPAAIRRLLNINGRFESIPGALLTGPPTQWVEQLAELVLDHGFSAFLLASDDAATLTTFAEGVAAPLRELISRERGTPATASPPGRGQRGPGGSTRPAV